MLRSYILKLAILQTEWTNGSHRTNILNLQVEIIGDLNWEIKIDYIVRV